MVCKHISIARTLLIAAVLLLSGTSLRAAEGKLKLTIAPGNEARRYAVAEYLVPAARLAAPFKLTDAQSGTTVPCQWEKAEGGALLRWIVPELPAGQARSYVVEHADAPAKDTLVLKEDAGGWLSVKSPSREITRYQFGPQVAKFNKPFFYPVWVHGVAATRSHPMEKKAGEDTDHVHHTSVYFCHGEVNGRDYWAKLRITPQRLLEQVSGPVYAKIVAENAWGNDLTEIQDIRIYDAGQDVLMDWVLTLKADKGPVNLGKTKEGGFAVRVATGLTDKGGGAMVDALGNKGEPAIRAAAAPWADNYGTVDGKTIGVAIMNHPSSWRFPTNWHVRGYGLFAANAFFVQGEHNMQQGDTITLKYRLYFHGGQPSDAKVQEVYAGYAGAKVTAE